MIGIRLKEADSEASHCRDINFYRKKHRCFKSSATLTYLYLKSSWNETKLSQLIFLFFDWNRWPASKSWYFCLIKIRYSLSIKICSRQCGDADDDLHVPNHHSIDYHQTLGGHTETLGLGRRQLLGKINIGFTLLYSAVPLNVRWRKYILPIGGCMHCCIENCLKTPRFPHKIHLKQYTYMYCIYVYINICICVCINDYPLFMYDFLTKGCIQHSI